MTIHEGLTVAGLDQMHELLGAGFVFRDCIFDRADVADLDAKELAFEDCSLRRADFSNLACEGLRIVNSDLSGSRFRAVDFNDAKLDAVKIDRANFGMASLRDKEFKKQKLVGVVFTEADISGCDFTDVEFEGGHLNGTTVSEETVFDGADLRGAYISSSHLDIVSLTGAIMMVAQARDLLKEIYGLVIVEDVV
jgi:fluoroquinolone resistance protein